MPTPGLWLTYCGQAPVPGSALSAWNLDPALLLTIAAVLCTGLVYFPETRRTQIAAALVAVGLFVSPLCALGAALFSVRTVHHLLLIFVLAPLLAAIFPRPGAMLSKRLPALTAIQALIFWAWHAPQAYAAALSDDALFWAMQVSITASAAAWWHALRGSSALAAGSALLANMVQMGLLGALIVFAGRPHYAPHFLTTGPWVLDPLDDQQIAGLIMWVVGSGAFLLIAAVTIYRALALPRPASTVPA